MKAKDHPLYQAWAGMINRTTKSGKKKCYDHVSVFQPWMDRTRPVSPGPCWGLLRFAEYVDEFLGPQNGLSLDRIDPNLGYEPGNIRWATLEEQNRNRRSGWTKPSMTPNGRLPWAHPYKDQWHARFCLNGSIYSAGYYTSQEEAHAAAKTLRNTLLCRTT